MAQWLEAPAALPEDLGSVPSTHKVAPNHLYLRLQEIQHHLLPPWVPGRQVVHVNMKQKRSYM